MSAPRTDPFLDALLGTLLPGGQDWPSAAQTQVAAFMTRRAAEFPRLAGAIAELRAGLPADFAERGAARRAACLRELEARDPALLAPIVEEAYRGYYTDPSVLAAIERKTGYPARPPQPLGRKVQPFDWSVLAPRSIGPAQTRNAPRLMEESE